MCVCVSLRKYWIILLFVTCFTWRNKREIYSYFFFFFFCFSLAIERILIGGFFFFWDCVYVNRCVLKTKTTKNKHERSLISNPMLFWRLWIDLKTPVKYFFQVLSAVMCLKRSNLQKKYLNIYEHYLFTIENEESTWRAWISGLAWMKYTLNVYILRTRLSVQVRRRQWLHCVELEAKLIVYLWCERFYETRVKITEEISDWAEHFCCVNKPK